MSFEILTKYFISQSKFKILSTSWHCTHWKDNLNFLKMNKWLQIFNQLTFFKAIFFLILMTSEACTQISIKTQVTPATSTRLPSSHACQNVACAHMGTCCPGWRWPTGSLYLSVTTHKQVLPIVYIQKSSKVIPNLLQCSRSHANIINLLNDEQLLFSNFDLLTIRLDWNIAIIVST